MTAPLFHSTHAALTFAFTFVGQPPLGILARMAGPPTGSGKGLVGLDGAAQAGMILAEVKELGPACENLLTARFAPRTKPCTCRAPCCSGAARVERWEQAIAWITEQAIRQLSGCISNYKLRRGVVCRYFGERVNLGELAEYAKCNRDTVAEHNHRIATWLRKEDSRAWHAVDSALKAAGMV